jgi:hypothetical protein
LTRPPPPGILPLGFHRGKLSLVSVAEAPQLGGNLIRFGLPIEKHCVIVVKNAGFARRKAL